jgi:chromosome segregation ATPase
MNETSKMAVYIIIALIISIAFGLVTDHYRESVEPGELAKLNRAVQQKTDRTIEELERTVSGQRERINNLEASNNRLTEHIGNARRISAELTVSTESTAVDIRSAIELLEKITIQVTDLNRELDSGDTGSGGLRGMAGVYTE